MERDYDRVGRMVTETLTLEGQSCQTALDYDVRNQLTQILYPSGRTVDYSYTDRRQLDTERLRKGQPWFSVFKLDGAKKRSQNSSFK